MLDVMTEMFDCLDRAVAGDRNRLGRQRAQGRQPGRTAHRHRLRHRRGRLRQRGRVGAALGQGSRSRHARSGARRLLAHDRGPGVLRPAHCSRTHPCVLARRAESRGAAGAVAAMGSRRCARHRHGAHAPAPGGHRAAARGGTDGGVEREHLGSPGRRHRRRRAKTNSATSSRCISMPDRPNNRRPRRSSTSPVRTQGCCGRGR